MSQLPQTIPSYLIEVVPEFKVEGETVLSGPAMTLGEDLSFSFAVTMPVFGTRISISPVIAGSYLSVAVVGGSVSVKGLAEPKLTDVLG